METEAQPLPVVVENGPELAAEMSEEEEDDEVESRINELERKLTLCLERLEELLVLGRQSQTTQTTGPETLAEVKNLRLEIRNLKERMEELQDSQPSHHSTLRPEASETLQVESPQSAEGDPQVADESSAKRRYRRI
jgi:hypothetical protein